MTGRSTQTTPLPSPRRAASYLPPFSIARTKNLKLSFTMKTSSMVTGCFSRKSASVLPPTKGRNQLLLQMDYEQKIGQFKFETGWRSTIQEITTDADFDQFGLNEFFTIDSLSNIFSLPGRTFHGRLPDFLVARWDDLTFSAGTPGRAGFLPLLT